MSLNLVLQYLLPKHILSRLVAKIANCRISLIKNFIISQYCKFYNIDMSDAFESNPLNYSTFNDFFTRALKPNARPITDDPKAIISPRRSSRSARRPGYPIRSKSRRSCAPARSPAGR